MVSSGESVFVSVCLSCLEEVSLVSEEEAMALTSSNDTEFISAYSS